MYQISILKERLFEFKKYTKSQNVELKSDTRFLELVYHETVKIYRYIRNVCTKFSVVLTTNGPTT